jgi:DNA-binding winged helix-turn-helix (wHTH) protein
VIYRFDAYSLDTESLKLRRNDVVVPVEPQVFSVLVYLIGNRDRVVGKDELIDAVWDGRAISDGALNSRINAVRRAVGDDGTAQAVIKTFTRRGFRFAGTMNRKNQSRSARRAIRNAVHRRVAVRQSVERSRTGKFL